jgi:hypothetical protein
VSDLLEYILFYGNKLIKDFIQINRENELTTSAASSHDNILTWTIATLCWKIDEIFIILRKVGGRLCSDFFKFCIEKQ